MLNGDPVTPLQNAVDEGIVNEHLEWCRAQLCREHLQPSAILAPGRGPQLTVVGRIFKAGDEAIEGVTHDGLWPFTLP
jgi:hypothetical protein